MTIELKKLASIGAILTALTAAPAMAQEIGDWDGDGDGALNEEEFHEGWGNSFGEEESAYSTWDEDGDGSLTEDEYNAGVYNSYDDDGDGSLNEEEFGEVGDDMGDGGFWDV